MILICAYGVPVVRNALTIDVEDWYHVCGVESAQPVDRKSWRVQAATEIILSLLDEYGTKATFFVLGSVAEGLPGLVERIAAGGHEVASHGWSHALVHDLTSEQFLDELTKTEEIILRHAGALPAGFRAPQWSVSQRTPRVHEILAERGYCYDSSMTPLALIGDPHGPRVPHPVRAGGRVIWEIPPLVTPTWFGNMPTGGGWGFRFFPLSLIEHTVGQLNAAGHPAVFYLHPRDVDPEGPRLRLPPLKRFAAYGTRKDAVPRIRRLLDRFDFATLKELAADDLLHTDSVV